MGAGVNLDTKPLVPRVRLVGPVALSLCLAPSQAADATVFDAGRRRSLPRVRVGEAEPPR